MDKTRERILVLDGLRFFAAFTVMMAHYVHWVVCDQGVHNWMTNFFGSLSAIGMPLFFVLSGFVVHYNYRNMYEYPGGVKAYLIARFTRIYPLYLILFIIEFIICFHLWRGSCGHAGNRLGFFLALPYHLSLTQDWFYGIIAKNSLIYQYHMCSGVSWSLSLEFFFYLFYLFLARWLPRQKKLSQLILFALVAQLAVVLLLICCYRFENVVENIALVGFGECATMHNGYQDSLLRWIYYFNPLVNLPAFFFGAALAQIHLLKKPLNRFELRLGNWITFLSLVSMLSVHFWICLGLAPTHGFFGRTGSILVAPLMACVIFCLIRYSSTFFNRILAIPLFVKLGEASYSIYLLHAFFGWYSRDYYHFHLNPWLLYGIAMCCILIISRASYLIFERPVQKWLRNIMLGKREVKTSLKVAERA